MAGIRTASLLTLLIVVSFPFSIYAHHGNAIYDMKHTVTLTGTVTQLALANPHSSIAFDVKSDQGNIDHWVVEFSVLQKLKAQGWADDTLSPCPSQKRPGSRRRCREDNFLRRWPPGASKPTERPTGSGSRHPLVDADACNVE